MCYCGSLSYCICLCGHTRTCYVFTKKRNEFTINYPLKMFIIKIQHCTKVVQFFCKLSVRCSVPLRVDRKHSDWIDAVW